jgi:hypothetical protein|tara:strand:+ start:582 stop:809 length:228 start_codon:yes stop_codon:yes gene_type:complete
MVETIKNTPRVINDFRVRGKETPLQNKIRQFVKENPNCTVADICKGMKWKDDSGVRRAIRKMVVSHKIVQRFNIS